jgi:outer membrane lipoprotein-sorting protein
MRSRPALIFAFFALAAVSHAADPLTPVFDHIDAAAKTFKGLTADISNTQHYALVDTNEVSAGAMRLLRVKPGLTRLFVTLKDSGGIKTFAVNGNEGRSFNPKTNILDVYDLSTKQGLVDQFLLLGFGATSAELKSTYDVTYVGEEKIGAQMTSHLKLIPKSAETLRTLKQADLWFAPNGLVTQQKLLWASGDYKLVTYSNVKLGAPPEKELELNPKGATIQKQSLK